MIGERTRILERYRRKDHSIAKALGNRGKYYRHQTNVRQTDDEQTKKTII